MQITASQRNLYVSVVSLIIALSGAQADEVTSTRYCGVYLGQIPPGHKPEPFTEEIFSVWGDYGFHLGSCLRFSPDGTELFFSNQSQPVVPGKAESIWWMYERNGTWTEPRLAVFSSDYDDAGAFYSRTGDTLCFHSLRPSKERGVPKDADIWYVTRKGVNWSEPVRLGHPVNTVYSDLGGVVTADGTLYFSSDRPEGRGGVDIYYTRFPEDEYGSVTNLGTTINTDADEHVAFVSDDESYMIIHRSDRHDVAQNGLYLSHKDSHDAWTNAKSMGDHFKALNAVDASVSPDGEYLFFLSQGNGVYWMKTAIIEYLKNEDLEISKRLIETMHSEGLRAAVLNYSVLQQKHASYIDINEYLLNQRGHQLLDTEQLADAIALFEILIALFPQSWNAYDSLGEAYFASGRITQARECYERSLELNPRNENAAVMLERIHIIQHH